MTDQPFSPGPEQPAEADTGAAASGDAPGGTGFDDADAGAASRSAQAREWMVQLQQMIDRIAAEAAPVAREVAAKAAELAAVAGEKAGPFAKRAAEVTGDVGVRVAERSRRLAEDLRHRAEGGPAGGEGSGGGDGQEG